MGWISHKTTCDTQYQHGPQGVVQQTTINNNSSSSSGSTAPFASAFGPSAHVAWVLGAAVALVLAVVAGVLVQRARTSAAVADVSDKTAPQVGCISVPCRYRGVGKCSIHHDTDDEDTGCVILLQNNVTTNCFVSQKRAQGATQGVQATATGKRPSTVRQRGSLRYVVQLMGMFVDDLT